MAITISNDISVLATIEGDGHFVLEIALEFLPSIQTQARKLLIKTSRTSHVLIGKYDKLKNITTDEYARHIADSTE